MWRMEDGRAHCGGVGGGRECRGEEEKGTGHDY